MNLIQHNKALLPALLTNVDNKTLRFALTGASVILGSLLFALSAKTHVPFYPVPMTMQVFVAFIIAGAYGWRLGLATYAVYMLEGAFGLPVFSGTPERGIGLVYMAGPTMGYLIGFAASIGLYGYFLERFKAAPLWINFIAGITGLALIYLFGSLWLVNFVPLAKVIPLGILPFILGDTLKVLLAVLITYGLQKARKQV